MIICKILQLQRFSRKFKRRGNSRDSLENRRGCGFMVLASAVSCICLGIFSAVKSGQDSIYLDSHKYETFIDNFAILCRHECTSPK